MTIRAMTTGEETTARSKLQRTKLYLDIDTPPVVFACQINQTFASLDQVLELTYDNVTTGAYGSVLVNMTVLIGSTPGADDIGACRVRLAPDATKIYIGATSEIPFADNQYLTVIDEFDLWAKQLKTQSDGSLLVDSQILYVDQNDKFAPIVIAGPARRVAKLTGSYIDIAFNLSESWVPGSSISSYSCSAPGSTSITGGTTSTPTVRYSATGRYRVSFTVNAANLKTTTVHRTVRIWNDADPLYTVFQISDGAGDVDDGGWNATIKAYFTPSVGATIRKRAMVTLVAEDWYDDTQVSLGQIAGVENIVMIGWISTEEIHANAKGGYATFRVYGPHTWLSQMGGTQITLTNAVNVPTKWSEIQNMTVDKALAQFVTYRSTIGTVMDVFPSGDTRISDKFPDTSDMLWSQITGIVKRILAKPCCDPQGRLFVFIDPQVVEVGNRSGIPVITTLQYKSDWHGDLIISQKDAAPISQLEVSANIAQTGAATKVVYSLAVGHILKRFGTKGSAPDKDLLVSSQAQANAIAALLLGTENVEYDFEIHIIANNRMVGICPAQYVALNISADDNPRGIAFTGNMVVKHIDMSFQNGYLQFAWHGDEESQPENSMDGDTPNNDGNTLPPLPSAPPIPPIPPSTTGTLTKNVMMLIKDHGLFYTSNFDTSDPGGPTWHAWNDGVDATLFGYPQFFDISKTSGIAYFLQNSVKIFTCTRIGTPWSLLDTDVTLAAKVGGTYVPSGISAIGINPMADDELVVLAGAYISGNTGTNYGRWFKGGSAGLTFITTNPDDAHGNFYGFLGHILYGSNKWFAYYEKYGACIARINRSASSVELFSILVGIANGSARAVRAGVDGQIAFLSGGGFISGLPVFKKTPDNGTTLSDITIPSGMPFSEWYEYYDVDPSGSFLLLGTGGLTTYKSSDGGATWGTVVFTNAVTAVRNLGTQNDWILGAGNQVWYTPDFGNSFVNKTGNLQTWVTAPFTIAQIRSY